MFPEQSAEGSVEGCGPVGVHVSRECKTVMETVQKQITQLQLADENITPYAKNIYKGIKFPKLLRKLFLTSPNWLDTIFIISKIFERTKTEWRV